MIEVHTLEDCGNSPKNQLVQDLCLSYLLASIPESEHTFLIARQDLLELYDFAHIQPSIGSGIKSISIKSVLSHGRFGAVEYELIAVDDTTTRACMVVEFQTATARKIVRITTYTAWV